jgi:hypothetical protein
MRIVRGFGGWRGRLWPAALLVLPALMGCPKAENFPTGLDLVVPPTPDTFVVSYVDVDPAGGFDYDISWSINDPAGVVDHYRLYLLDAGPAPQLLTETDQTTRPSVFPYVITGLRLGVSAVSTGHVEGRMRIAVVQ